MKIPFNNDRLSHWLIGAVLGWGLAFGILYYPVFHMWLKVSTAKAAMLTGLFCAAQLAITPWLFAARATPQNPRGRPAQRSKAVAVLASLVGLIFFAFIGSIWPRTKGTLEFTLGGIVSTALVVIIFVAGHGKWHLGLTSDFSRNSGPTHNPDTNGDAV